MIEITTEIVTVASRKGGTGKTTTAFNLAYSLTEFDRKILLIDLDDQANLTRTAGTLEEVEGNIYNLLVDGVNINSVIYETKFKDIDIIPSSLDFLIFFF